MQALEHPRPGKKPLHSRNPDQMRKYFPSSRAQRNFGLVRMRAKCCSGVKRVLRAGLYSTSQLHGGMDETVARKCQNYLGMALLLPPTEELIDEVSSVRRSINCPRSRTETIGVACALRSSKRKRSPAVSSRLV